MFAEPLASNVSILALTTHLPPLVFISRITGSKYYLGSSSHIILIITGLYK